MHKGNCSSDKIDKYAIYLFKLSQLFLELNCVHLQLQECWVFYSDMFETVTSTKCIFCYW